VSYIADGVKYAGLLSELLAQGKLKPTPVLIMPKGLASVNDGFKYMIDGKAGSFKFLLQRCPNRATAGQRPEGYIPDRRYARNSLSGDGRVK
jgi:hypothetical protein